MTNMPENFQKEYWCFS